MSMHSTSAWHESTSYARSVTESTRPRFGKPSLRVATTLATLCVLASTAAAQSSGNTYGSCRVGFVNRVATQTCVPCPPGSSSRGGEATSCEQCPKGTHNAAFGGVCERCPWNSFARAANASSCSFCPSLTWQGVISPPGRFVCRGIINDAFAILLLVTHSYFFITACCVFLIKTDAPRRNLFLGAVAPRMLLPAYSTLSYIMTVYPSGTGRIAFAFLFPNPGLFFLLTIASAFVPGLRARPVPMLTASAPNAKASDTAVPPPGMSVLNILLWPVHVVGAAIAYTTCLLAFERYDTAWRRALPHLPDFSFIVPTRHALRAPDLSLVTWNVIRLCNLFLSTLPTMGLAIYVIIDSAVSGEDFSDYVLQVGKVIISGGLLVKLSAEWLYRIRAHGVHPLHMDPTLTVREVWGFSAPEVTKSEGKVAPQVAPEPLTVPAGKHASMDMVVTDVE